MNTQPTPNAEVNSVLTEMLTNAKQILGDNFIACYLQGSFAAGDWDTNSDIDFITVVQRDLSDTEYNAIEAMHAGMFDMETEWSKHVEGSYLPLDILRRTDAMDVTVPFLDHGHRVLERSTHCNTLVVRWVTREHGITLDGPPPTDFISPVSSDALRREILVKMQDWAQEIYAQPETGFSLWYQPYIVVMFCRMLHSIETGRIESKRAGVRWAKTTLDAKWLGLVQRAWEERTDLIALQKWRLPAVPEEIQPTIEFVRYAIALGEGKLHPS